MQNEHVAGQNVVGVPRAAGAHRFVRHAAFYLMILPAAVLLFAFSYVPLQGLVLAFQDFSPRLLFGSRWVGLAHFRRLFVQDPFLPRVLRNTLILVALKAPFGVLVPLGLALALN